MPSGIYKRSPRPIRMAKCHPDRRHFGKGLCSSCYQKQYFHPNPEVDKQSKSRWDKSEAGDRYRKEWRIKKLYGITLAEYNSILASQNNLCALCKEPFIDAQRHRGGPVLDHDHTTKKNRAFIHRTCNVVLGYLEDDPKRCRLAAEYLEKYASEDRDGDN